RCLAVDLGMVLLDNLLLLADQPLAADREAAVALAFLDTGLLQQRQGAATGTKEDEPGLEYLVLATLFIPGGNLPAAVPALAQALHGVAQAQLEILLGGQVLDHVTGQG